MNPIFGTVVYTESIAMAKLTSFGGWRQLRFLRCSFRNPNSHPEFWQTLRHYNDHATSILQCNMSETELDWSLTPNLPFKRSKSTYRPINLSSCKSL